MDFGIQLLAYVVCVAITLGVWAAVSTVTGGIVLLVMLVWLVLIWGGFLILDSDDFF